MNPYILLQTCFLLFLTNYNSYRIRAGMFPNIFPFSSLTSYLSLLTSHMIAFTHVWWMRLNVMYTMQIKIQTIESSTYSSHSTLTSKYFMSWLYLIFLWIVDIALILVQSQWGRGHVTKALCMRGYAVVGKLHSAIYSKSPILRSTKPLGQPENKFPMDEMLVGENSKFAR